MKKVSLIIPFYKVEKYIEKCLDSIINQTYTNLEIICIGPGDLKDLSYPIVKRYAKIDKRIIFLTQKLKGQGNARNLGLDNISGDYVLFVDSDDYLQKDCIMKLVNIIEKENSDFVCCGFDRVDYHTEKVYSREMINNPKKIIINDNNIKDLVFINPSVWGKLFKKSVLKNIRFSTDKNSVEDLMYILECYTITKKISFCNEILWHYLVRDNSAVLTTSHEKADAFKSDMIILKQKYCNLKLSKSYLNMLDMIAFIHGAIAIPTRIYNNKSEKFSIHVKNVKKFLDCEFPNWRKIGIKQKTTGNGIKNFGLYVIKLMYIVNIEILFFAIYNFMINRLKFDIKW